MRNLAHLVLVALTVVALMSHRSVAQILNAGFEDWSGGNPANWYTSNLSVPGMTLVNVTQSSSAHSGAYALQGTVIQSFVGTPYGPVVVAGTSGIGFPINSRPEALHGWYKLASDSGDGFAVAMALKRGNDGVGAGGFASTTPQSTYKEFVVNTIYVTGDVPDMVHITFSAYYDGPRIHLSSTFWVDDLSFGPATDVKEFRSSLPNTFALGQNYPNPFNPSTKIEFEIPDARFVTLKVYNVLGQEVTTLVNEHLGAGRYRAEFSAGNLPSGTYLYRLLAGDFSAVKKMTVLK